MIANWWIDCGIVVILDLILKSWIAFRGSRTLPDILFTSNPSFLWSVVPDFVDCDGFRWLLRIQTIYGRFLTGIFSPKMRLVLGMIDPSTD